MFHRTFNQHRGSCSENERIVVTDKRVMMAQGSSCATFGMMGLGEGTDLTFRRSLSGRMLGYGTMVVEWAGWDPGAEPDGFHAPPGEISEALSELVFGEKGKTRAWACWPSRAGAGRTLRVAGWPGSTSAPTRRPRTGRQSRRPRPHRRRGRAGRARDHRPRHDRRMGRGRGSLPPGWAWCAGPSSPA